MSSSRFQSPYLVVLPLFLMAGASLSSCGGGGGSNGYGGAAEIRIEASPEELDVGDRVRIEMDVKEIHESGVVVKIRYPSELTYVDGSAELFVDESTKEYPPSTIQSVEDDTYLLFRMRDNDGGENNHATIIFELRASASKNEAKIAVDPDVDSTTPFDPENPEFETEADVQVDIEG